MSDPNTPSNPDQPPPGMPANMKLGLGILAVAVVGLVILMFWWCTRKGDAGAPRGPNALGPPPVSGPGSVKLADFTLCATCHGPNGEGVPAMHGPRIGGQADWYVRAQLQKFKDGHRGTNPKDLFGTQMRPMALQVADMDGMVARVTSLSGQGAAPPVGAPVVNGDAAHGRVLYAQCVACHGADGQGERSINGPIIAGQESWYVQQQLLNFREGIRGGDPADREGSIMKVVVSGLSDQDIADLALHVKGMK